ncbi:tRNA (adenine-N1)-methyltransferase [Bifidobacterium aquikefiricola]|uniref:tRNA (adenine(58)-N(1))-methyltransferase TrmI n=1 Tax=Bifidobacterium aquikefiricola TaxID=3059038 RepID=A0AB39U8K2_9BIFI
MPKRGPLCVGEKVQLTDRKGAMITALLEHGGMVQTQRGVIPHDSLIGMSEGSVVVTQTSAQSSEADHAGVVPENANASNAAVQGSSKPWKHARHIGGWSYTVMRPRLADFVLSMPRGAQIMYPKDIAHVLTMGDIRSGMRVLESGAGSGAMSLHLLDAVGEQGHLTTIERRSEFARIASLNAAVYFGGMPAWWNLLTGDFDEVAKGCKPHFYDRVVLDMLDPWNRLEYVEKLIVPGGVLSAYVTTTTQMSRLVEKMRERGSWTEPEVSETIQRDWKVQGLAVRPNHQMIGHTGFIVISRAMQVGVEALHRRERATKNTYTDIDDATPSESLEELELRDLSDRKLRKVLRDLEHQATVVQSDMEQGAPDES